MDLPSAKPAEKLSDLVLPYISPFEISVEASEPIFSAQTTVRPQIDLLTSHNKNLEQRIKGLLSMLGPTEKAVVYVHDIAEENPSVSINAGVPVQAASMIKSFIALAYFHEVSAGNIRHTQQENLEKMFSKSDNDATNQIIRMLGGPSGIDRILKTYYPLIFQQTGIVEEIPPSGASYLNKASGLDYYRFFAALHSGTLPYSDELKELLGLPKKGFLFYKNEIPQDIIVRNKGGSTGQATAESASVHIFTHDGYLNYVFVVIIQRERPKDEPENEWKLWRNKEGYIIRRAFEMVYSEMAGKKKEK